MIPSMRRSAIALAAIVLAAGAGDAAAKAQRTAAYRMNQVWPTAVRFLRVDEGLEIVEKDPDAGYVIFVVKDKTRSFNGALELIATTEPDGRQVVRLVLSIDGRPEYTEAGLLDRMLEKLAREHGDAPEPVAPPPAKKPPQKK
jgi:hypothetical protein